MELSFDVELLGEAVEVLEFADETGEGLVKDDVTTGPHFSVTYGSESGTHSGSAIDIVLPAFATVVASQDAASTQFFCAEL